MTDAARSSVDATGAGPAGGVSTAPDRPLHPALLALAMLLFAICGLLGGVLCVTLIPLRAGATLVPIAPVLALAIGVLLPGVARGLTDSIVSAAPPAVGQVLGIWVLSMGRPEVDVLMPAGSTATVSYAVLILGTLAPLFMLGLASRPGPWTWTTLRQGALKPGRRRTAQAPAAPGSGSGDAR